MNVKLETQICCSVSLTQVIDVLLGFVAAAIRALYLQCYIIIASFFYSIKPPAFLLCELYLLALNKEIFAWCFWKCCIPVQPTNKAVYCKLYVALHLDIVDNTVQAETPIYLFEKF